MYEYLISKLKGEDIRYKARSVISHLFFFFMFSFCL